jgi:hypothetical protein
MLAHDGKVAQESDTRFWVIFARSASKDVGSKDGSTESALTGRDAQVDNKETDHTSFDHSYQRPEECGA